MAGLEPIEAVAAKVRKLHRRAAFCCAQRVALGNRMAAFVRTEFLGFSTFDDAPARAKAVAAAAKLIKAAREDKPLPGLDPDEATELRLMIAGSDAAMEPFLEMEERCLKFLRKLVKELPGYAFVQATRGFGDTSFARIIGETGPLHLYTNPAKVWKRLGLAVINGVRQGKHSHPDLAALHGYNPRRRSVGWVAFDSLMRAQGAGDEPGPYRVVYDEAKARYAQREGWTKMHVHRAASRYAEKRLILHLWRAWRDDIRGHGRSDTQRASAPDPLPPGQLASVTHCRVAGSEPLGSGQYPIVAHVGIAAPEHPLPPGQSPPVTHPCRAGRKKPRSAHKE